MRARSSLAFTLVLPLAVVGCSRSPTREPIARAKGAWYWHGPVQLDPAQSEDLTKIGITELYPLAGTFSNDGSRLVLRLRREFRPLPANVGTRIAHLVYRFDRGAVQHALDEEPKAVAERVALAFSEDRASATKGGWEVRGIQLDLDCPTRRLARYGEILSALRERLPRGTLLSVTGLGDWLNGDVATMLRPVDFWCPQLYEFETPRRLDALPKLSAIGQIDRYRPRLERLGIPYRIGIAAHGQALFFVDGRLDGTVQGVSPSAAARRYPAEPSIRSVEGEERAAYRVSPNRVLLFRRPDPRAVRRAMAAMEGGSGSDAGFVLFRVAEPGEELTPSLRTLALGPEPRDVEIRTRASGDPFGAIERGAGSVDAAITLEFVSRAKTAPPLAADGLSITLSFDPGAVESIAPGDFPNLRLVDASGRGPVSLARAAGAVATAPGIPTEGLRLGPVVKKSGKLRVVARVRGYGAERVAQKEL